MTPSTQHVPNSADVMVVAGGTGNIGEGIVRAGLRSGATVVVPSRSRSRLDELRRYVEEFGVDGAKLDTRVTDVSDFSQARHLLAQVAADHGHVDLTVGSLGGYWSGPGLLQTEEGEFQRVLTDNLTAHYTFARHALSLMAAQGHGTHVLIAGPGNLLFNRHASLVTITGHAQLAMAQILDAEAREQGVRSYQLFVGHIQDRRRGGGGGPGVVTPDQVGERVLDLSAQRPKDTVHTLFAQAVPGFPLPTAE